MVGIGERGLPGDRDLAMTRVQSGIENNMQMLPDWGYQGAKQKRLAEQKRFEGSVTKNRNREPQRRLMTIQRLLVAGCESETATLRIDAGGERLLRRNIR